MASVMARGSRISPGFSRPSVSWCTLRLWAQINPDITCMECRIDIDVHWFVKTQPSFCMLVMSGPSCTDASRAQSLHFCANNTDPFIKEERFSMQVGTTDGQWMPVLTPRTPPQRWSCWPCWQCCSWKSSDLCSRGYHRTSREGPKTQHVNIYNLYYYLSTLQIIFKY